jgi:hypothetical protein
MRLPFLCLAALTTLLTGCDSPTSSVPSATAATAIGFTSLEFRTTKFQSTPSNVDSMETDSTGALTVDLDSTGKLLLTLSVTTYPVCPANLPCPQYMMIKSQQAQLQLDRQTLLQVSSLLASATIRQIASTDSAVLGTKAFGWNALVRYPNGDTAVAAYLPGVCTVATLQAACVLVPPTRAYANLDSLALSLQARVPDSLWKPTVPTNIAS